MSRTFHSVVSGAGKSPATRSVRASRSARVCSISRSTGLAGRGRPSSSTRRRCVGLVVEHLGPALGSASAGAGTARATWSARRPRTGAHARTGLGLDPRSGSGTASPKISRALSLTRCLLRLGARFRGDSRVEFGDLLVAGRPPARPVGPEIDPLELRRSARSRSGSTGVRSHSVVPPRWLGGALADGEPVGEQDLVGGHRAGRSRGGRRHASLRIARARSSSAAPVSAGVARPRRRARARRSTARARAPIARSTTAFTSSRPSARRRARRPASSRPRSAGPAALEQEAEREQVVVERLDDDVSLEPGLEAAERAAEHGREPGAAVGEPLERGPATPASARRRAGRRARPR